MSRLVEVRDMKLDLSEIAATLGKQFHYEFSDDCGECEDVRCAEPATGVVAFTNTGRVIVARGSFGTTIELDCSRCLEPFALPVKVKIDEQLPISNLQALMAGYEDDDVEEEEPEPLFEHNVFDLSEYIRQMILVESPIRPLCGDNCKGLCPTCGRNLNEGSCDCPPAVHDSPFGVLAEMLADKDGVERVE